MVKTTKLKRFDIYLVSLDPTVGSEIRKTRPCVVVSPNDIINALNTVLIAPMTTKGQPYPWRPVCKFGGKTGRIAIDQIRAVDAIRLRRKLGTLDTKTGAEVINKLQEFFAA